MSYSCSDFVDSILDALGIGVPEENRDSPSAQADLALAKIAALQQPQKVFVATYSHKHGDDQTVYATFAGAVRARNDIATQWWDREIGDGHPKPENPDAIGEAYFDYMNDHGEEWFTIQECEVLP